MSNVLFASSVTYLIPVVAVVIGMFFGESFNFWQLAAMLVVLAGVYVANKKVLKTRGKPKKSE